MDSCPEMRQSRILACAYACVGNQSLGVVTLGMPVRAFITGCASLHEKEASGSFETVSRFTKSCQVAGKAGSEQRFAEAAICGTAGMSLGAVSFRFQSRRSLDLMSGRCTS